MNLQNKVPMKSRILFGTSMAAIITSIGYSTITEMRIGSAYPKSYAKAVCIVEPMKGPAKELDLEFEYAKKLIEVKNPYVVRDSLVRARETCIAERIEVCTELKNVTNCEPANAQKIENAETENMHTLSHISPARYLATLAVMIFGFSILYLKPNKRKKDKTDQDSQLK